MKLGKRVLLILSFFISIIFILQLARMGVLNNSKKFTNKSAQQPKAVSAQLPDLETKMNGFKATIITDYEDDGSVRCSSNFESLMTKYRIPFKIVGSSETADFDPSDTIVFMTMTDYDRYGNFDKLFAYIRNGGNVIFAGEAEPKGTYQSINSSLGIIENYDGVYSDYIIDKKGIIGPAGTEYSYYEMVRCVRTVRLMANCEVYLANENNIPLFWRVSYGEGNIYNSNCNLIDNPTGRGVVSAVMFECAGRSMLYPAYGILTSALESFPGPTIVGDYKIFREIKKSYDSFAKEVVWIDFTRLTRKYGIVHTISYVQSYNSNTKPPFEESSLLPSALLTYGSEVLDNGGELATHGFSYRPFGYSGEVLEKGWFVPWGNYTDIKASCDATAAFCREVFPNYKIRCYFPPEGRISDSVLRKMPQLMPDVKIICFPYHNNIGDQLYGDFQQGKYGLFNYCTTSGIEGAKWNAQNSLLSLGIISQSIDIPYAITVNRLSWSDVIGDVSEIYSQSLKMMPAMKPMTVSDAVERLKMYEKMTFDYKETDSGLEVYVNGWFEGMSFNLRTAREPVAADGVKVYKLGKDIYNIVAEKPEFKLSWGG